MSSRPVTIGPCHLGAIVDNSMTPKNEVHGKANVKRNDGLQLVDFLWRQLDTECCDIGQQIGDLALSNNRKDVRRFMQKIRQALFSISNCKNLSFTREGAKYQSMKRHVLPARHCLQSL